MRILFATAHPHLPQFSGGSQSSTHELALELAERGHRVAVLAALSKAGYIGLKNRALMKILNRRTIVDRAVGYDVYRKWFVWEDVGEVVEMARPDVAIVQAMKPVPTAAALTKRGVPTIIYLRDVEFDSLGGDLRGLDRVTYIANSQFTADRYKEAFGIRATPIPPLFRPDLYRAEREPANVTFVNPHVEKGRDLAFEVARACPDIPFAFVESWPLEGENLEIVRQRLRETPNVTFVPRTNDMRAVYAKARVLLVPSQWEEAWGRVVSEAHFSGIPVVASARGGLPESVGPGGLIIEPTEPLDAWVSAIRRLWSDEAFYAEKSRAADHHSRRAELDRSHQITKLLDVVGEAVRRRRSLARASVSRQFRTGTNSRRFGAQHETL